MSRVMEIVMAAASGRANARFAPMARLHARCAFAVVLLAAPPDARANDGAIYAHGDTLHPIKETRVALRKEVLTVTRRGEWFHVEVDFDFENPDPAERKVTTGFVTPLPYGDVRADDEGIRDFTVVMNGQPLAWELRKHITSAPSAEWEVPSGNCAYVFTAPFQPGTNHVRHTYDIRAASSVEVRYELMYTLKSARSWANGGIDDFTLRFPVDDLDVIALPRDLFPRATVTFHGLGREHRPGARIFRKRFRVFAVKQGSVELHVSQFIPRENLYAVWMPPLFGGGVGLAPRETLYNELSEAESRLSDGVADARDLSLLRNAVYARHGRVFRKPALAAWFKRQPWYFPDPSATDGEIEKNFSREDQELLSRVAKQEKIVR